MKLFKHQSKALKQTEQFSRVAYYLDMGLGKTFVSVEKMVQLNNPVNLVVCQKSKVSDWVEHLTMYEEHFKMIYDCTLWDKNDWVAFEQNPYEPCVMVINYELVFRRSYIAHITGFTLLLDESSLIQNETAKRSKFILKLQPKNVILLSGTPTAGKYEKLWSQCRLLGWNITKKAFYNSFIVTEWLEDSTGFRIPIVTGYKNVERLQRKLAEHGAIFMKTNEAFELPQQNEIVVKVRNTATYRNFMKNSIVEFDGIELVGDTSLTKLLYARQLCGQYCKEKLVAFHDLVQSTEDRMIVFYNFYEELYAMQSVIADLERPISIVNGQYKDLKRYEEDENTISFIQYQSGAMGLNLQKANKTVYFTLPLSAELFEQSKKRTHRIGQEMTCFYYFLLCQNSIEYKILETLKLRKDYNDKLFEKEST